MQDQNILVLTTKHGGYCMFLEPDIYLFWSNRNNITSSHFVLSNCYITVIYLIYFRCICYSNIYSLFVYSRDVNNTFTNLIIFWIISMSYYDWAWNIVKFFYTNILLLIFYTVENISLLIYIYIICATEIIIFRYQSLLRPLSSIQ